MGSSGGSFNGGGMGWGVAVLKGSESQWGLVGGGWVTFKDSFLLVLCL